MGRVRARPRRTRRVGGVESRDPVAGRRETGGWRGAVAYCVRREHLRKTLRIAFVVGVILTAINQLDVILAGHTSAATWVKCGLNFVVPFCVSNAGLLSGRRS